jgi:formylglycine-generating enzyme required for sulfatase activity
MKLKQVSLAAILTAVLCVSGNVLAACPSADLTGDCVVNLADLAKMAEQWMTEGIPIPILNGMTWVSISDPGVAGHESFNGQMSKYETTNAQYCHFLNAALATGDVVVNGNYVYGSSGSNSGADFVGQLYYYLAGGGWTYNGATYGGAPRINWTGSSFTVDAGFENHPVTYVSWYGATAFASYYGWRLPTEWEWQAVADYDGSYTYGCGTSINNSIANYYGSTHPDGTTIVGSFGDPLGYGYGLCDMAGNVWEWTSSIASDNFRVLRGGAWADNNLSCTVLNTNVYAGPGWPDISSGFRVCR